MISEQIHAGLARYELRGRSVKALPHDGSPLVAATFDNDLLVRFKHLSGRDLQPTNVATSAQKQLARQRVPEHVRKLVMDDVELIADPTIVFCGYTRKGLALQRILIKCFHAGHQPWLYDIYGGIANIEPITIGSETTVEATRVVSRRKLAGDTEKAQ